MYEAELSQLIERVVDSHVPQVTNRTWLIDYLFKYSIGNKLPRGRDFEPFRIAEERQNFSSLAREYNHDIDRLTYKKRISPFLLQQRYLLVLAVINGHAQFDTDAIVDVIKKLENDSYAPSTDLIKHNLKFKKKGPLAEYKHHHVPMLPSSYSNMYAARTKDKENKMISLEALVSLVDGETGTIDLHDFEEKIKQSSAKKSGRMTGHWLITKEIAEERFYLGVFPHSDGSYDDDWIKNQLIKSEKMLFS